MKHLWRGQIITDEELEAHLPSLEETVATDLGRDFPLAILLDETRRLGEELLSGGELCRQFTALADGDSIIITAIAEHLREGATKLRRELGSIDPFTPRRPVYREANFEAWSPLGLLAHVTPANVATVSALSLFEGLLAGNINFVKLSSADGDLTIELYATLAQRAPQLAPYIYVARIPSRREDLLNQLFQAADGVCVWGSGETVESVRRMVPPSTRFIEWGHRISFAYVTAEQAEDTEGIQAIAEDVCRIEQQACSSPQCLYLETDDLEALNIFAQRFAAILAKVSDTTPPSRSPDPAEQAEITTVCHLQDLEGFLTPGAGVMERKGFRILIDPSPVLKASPLFRTIWLKPLPLRQVVKTLRPMRPWLQTAGLLCSRQRLAEVANALFAAGVGRVTRPGAQLGGYVGSPHDGVYALQRYCRRISLELEENEIASLAEMKTPAPPADLAKHPVLSKEDFMALTRDTRGELYFKSGGSSGEPKLSIFTWDDYHIQMRAAADGLFAAGFEPARDRAMNLYFSGHLYGSFISFWSILEELGAIQYPMTAVEDLETVGRIIVEQKIDTLLGIPFYLLRLFEHNAERFRAYRGIRKIFYGGEHLTPGERRRLCQEFGIEVIRSAAYGSNDAGPLGYQCSHCKGGEHHVLTQTQYLEIFDLEKDEPAAPGEAGRLLFTSLHRQGPPLVRYDIGDVGRWLPDPCPCGRAAPRFELMGRHGDLFRAPYFFSYQIIIGTLAEYGGYEGPVQIELDFEEGHHIISLLVRQEDGLQTQKLRQALLDHYHDLREWVVDRADTRLALRAIPAADFAMTPTTGKLKHIIDRRGKA